MSNEQSNALASVQTTDLRREYRFDRRAFWISVITSIVASILFGLFFQPIVNGISNVIVNTIGVFYTGYVDKLYYDAVQSPTDFMIFVTFFFITAAAPASLVGGMALGVLVQRTTGQTQRWIRRMILTAMPITLIAVFIAASGPAVSTKANSAFQRRLMALTPVITEDERKQILGTWALVNSKADYLKINDTLEELGKKHGITLPKRY
jgi:hypothetical protein